MFVWLWAVVGGSLLLVLTALAVALWHIALYRELHRHCQHNQTTLQQVRRQRDELAAQVQELHAGLRAEQGQVAQLKRQLQWAQA